MRLLVAALGFVSITATASDFSVQSPSLRNGARLPDVHVYKGFGCEGGNRSPALSWSKPPAGTKSFAITMYDPDAPTGSGWWHWVVYNIPASVVSLPEGAGEEGAKQLPVGAIQGRTDFGTAAYGGACPPSGDKPHRYIITVHALKVERLDVPSDAMPAMIGFMVNANRIGSAVLETNYSR